LSSFIRGPTPPSFSEEIVQELPSDTEFSIVSTRPILQEKVKCFKTGDELIDHFLGRNYGDDYEGGFEEGVNIIGGPQGTGKTTLALMVCFNALKEGKNVKYYDIENAIRKPRLLDMWEAMGKPFDVKRLNQTFLKVKNWTFDDLFTLVIKNLTIEKPDVLVIDAFTPIFLDRFFSASDKENFDILQKRFLLATQCQRLATEAHSVVIIIAHEKSAPPQKPDNPNKYRIYREATEFGGLGSEFGFQAKLQLYLGFAEDGTNIMVRLKHRFLPACIYTWRAEKEHILRYKITSKGLVGIE
jgi:archaellum biogenesis ATPase FlaH